MRWDNLIKALSIGDIAAVDLRPSMRTITDIKQRSDGNYEYIAEL